MIWSLLGVNTRSGFRQASTQTRANPGFGRTFTNLIGASPNLAIRAWQPNRIESSRSNFTHCKQTIYSYNPIALDHSRLIVYRCPYRVRLCLTHHSHPALLTNCKVIRAQRLYSISTRYLVIWSSDLILPDKNTPWPYLQKGITPFGCHRAGANSGQAVSTNFFLKIGVYLRTHDRQRNQQWSRMIQKER